MHENEKFRSSMYPSFFSAKPVCCIELSLFLGTGKSSVSRPQRRRTTVFSESQHRTLYQHFTHCNFPEPAMFRILAKLIGLDAPVIKIWFQNERSRQRKRASFMMEGNSEFRIFFLNGFHF